MNIKPICDIVMRKVNRNKPQYSVMMGRTRLGRTRRTIEEQIEVAMRLPPSKQRTALLKYLEEKVGKKEMARIKKAAVEEELAAKEAAKRKAARERKIAIDKEIKAREAAKRKRIATQKLIQKAKRAARIARQAKEKAAAERARIAKSKAIHEAAVERAAEEKATIPMPTVEEYEPYEAFVAPPAMTDNKKMLIAAAIIGGVGAVAVGAYAYSKKKR